MCDGGVFSVPIATAIIGGMVSQNAQNNALDKQKRIMASAEESQNRRQEEQQGLVLEEAMKFDPNKRNDSLDDTARAAEMSLGSAIADANAAAPQNNAGATGRVSDEYKVAQASSVADETARAAETARLMSRVRAPSDMLGNENLEYADMLSRVGTHGSKARGEWARDMGIMKGVRPNGGQMLLGEAIKVGGSMYGAGAAARAGAAGGAGAASKGGNSMLSSSGGYLQW